MQASPRLSTITVHYLLFADGCALDTISGGDIQQSMHLFATWWANFGLTVNTEETVVMHQSQPNAAYSVPRIRINRTELQNSGILRLLRQHTLTLHQHRRRIDSPDLQSQPSFRPAAELRMEPPWPPPDQQN
nr:unnamed protein product [Spirometra erinaceieuropaei]